ncbi:glycosyltransferase family 2 protein [Balneolaceae bacterium ANBcel3]|nr:glycosyltransferase family 2 protein [Balneolaceae bacterium ANBcel3]
MILILWAGLWLSLAFFLFTSAILVHNYLHFKSLETSEIEISEDKPMVSVLIPSRNEGQTLPKLLESLEKQDYSEIEILVLDDGSEDNTKQVADQFARNSSFEMRVISGEQRPEGWLGKNWACHQLSQAARGSLLLFLDADTWLDASAVKRMVAMIQKYELNVLTVWPHQCMPTRLEKTVIGTVYSTVALYLPTLYSYKAPRWIPTSTLKRKTKPLFASACGQCLLFDREAYQRTGGHASVKGEVVEDVMLARRAVASGEVMRMFRGNDTLFCRMYQNRQDLFNGFRKNFYAGFGGRLFPFVLSWILHLIVFIFPPILFIYLLMGGLNETSIGMLKEVSLIATLIPLLQRYWVDRLYQWPKSTGAYYLAGVLWFNVLAVVILFDLFFNRNIQWKGREIKA